MRAARGRAGRVGDLLRTVLFSCLLAPAMANGACISLRSHPDGALLAQIDLASVDANFSVVYVHSVIGTPVVEHYIVDDGQLVQTGMEFEQYGPGLPTEADRGFAFTLRDGHFVVTMARHFPSIVMRVNSDQTPLLVTGNETRDLAQWGNRALVLAAASCPAAS